MLARDLFLVESVTVVPRPPPRRLTAPASNSIAETSWSCRRRLADHATLRMLRRRRPSWGSASAVGQWPGSRLPAGAASGHPSAAPPKLNRGSVTAAAMPAAGRQRPASRSRFPLPATGYRLPATGFPLPAPLPGFRLSIQNCNRELFIQRSLRMQDYRNLRVWQKAHQLAINAYALPAYLQEPKGLGASRSHSQGGDINPFKHRRGSRSRLRS